MYERTPTSLIFNSRRHPSTPASSRAMSSSRCRRAWTVVDTEPQSCPSDLRYIHPCYGKPQYVAIAVVCKAHTHEVMGGGHSAGCPVHLGRSAHTPRLTAARSIRYGVMRYHSIINSAFSGVHISEGLHPYTRTLNTERGLIKKTNEAG